MHQVIFIKTLCGLSLYSAMEFQEGPYTDVSAVTPAETLQHLT